MRMRTTLLLAAPLIASAFIIAGCAAGTPGGHPAPSFTPVSGNPASSSARPAAASTSSAASAIAAWDTSGGGKALRKLTTALGDAGKTDPDNFTAMGDACQKVGTAVTSMQSAGPMPYPPAQKWLARALAQYSQGSADCQAGVQAGDARVIAEGVSHISHGTRDLEKATAALGALGD